MLQAFIMKRIAGAIIKKVMAKRELKKMKEYVEEDNELDIQMKQVQKNSSKNSKYIEELEKEVAILKRDSHPRADWICLECGCKAIRKKVPTLRRRKRKQSVK